MTGPDGKRTGRDPRVAPRTVVHDPELTAHLPVEISVTSAVPPVVSGDPAVAARLRSAHVEF